MRYEKDGLEFPSVTEIISDCTDKSQGLMRWTVKEMSRWIRQNCSNPDEDWYILQDKDLDSAELAFEDVSKTALDVGSEVHGHIEYYLKAVINGVASGIIYNFKSDQASKAFNAFLKWTEEHDLKPIALEQKVYGNGWAGTLDFIGYFDDKLYVIDWKSAEPTDKKTRKGIRPEMRYQVAAYRSVALMPNPWYHPAKYAAKYVGAEGCGVLRLDKTTGLPEWKDTSKSYEEDLNTFNAMVDLYFLRHPIIRKKAGR